MKLIICLDEKNGMMFNHRRQSRDARLIENLLGLIGDAPLRCSSYSAPLFPAGRVTASADYLSAAQDGDYCFAEERLPDGIAERADTLIVYRWNRSYPADVRFPSAPGALGLTLRETTDFAGSSHENITREVWSR